jgi:dihydroneopterin aldolase
VSSDRVVLRGLEFFGYHGVQPEENRLGQRFRVDIEMTVDTRDAGRADDLTKTVDYVRVHAEAKAIVEGPACKLIETVAERIAEAVLKGHRVESVVVRVQKPDVPIAGTLEYVGVVIERRTQSAERRV